MRTPPHYSYVVDGLPKAATPKPLILFLHGKGERGTDLSAVRAHGPPHLYPKYGLDRFIVLSPQCPADEKWDATKLDEFLTAFADEHAVDRQRIYLTGLSLGGEGAFDLLARCKDRFAASVLICGRVAPAAAQAIRGPLNPIWLFHSVRDEIVPVAHSDGLHEALQKLGGVVTYTRYDSLKHIQTWLKAYSGRRIFDWLLEHHVRA